jgi:hypothetical protein
MIFQRKEGILVERFDDQALVLDLENNLPYVLNGVAAYILMHSDGKSSQECIARKVCEEFDVGLEEAIEDTRRLYEELVLKKIVTRVG